MKTIKIINNQLVIQIPYDIGLVNLIKTSFSPRFWDSNIKAWKAPVNEKNILAAYSLATYHDFIIFPEAIQEIEKYKIIFDEQRKVADVRIAASKAIEANIEIPNLKGELFPFQKAGVQFIENNNGRVLVADEMGCISGDAEIIINRGGNGKKYKLKDAFNKFYNSWNKNIVSYTRSMNLNYKEFRLNKINNIIYKGVKPVYEIITETHKIKATGDHVFFSENGEKELNKLQIGEKIYTNGTEMCPLCGKNEKIITYKYSKFKGYCKECVYKYKRNNHLDSVGEKIDKDGYTVITKNLTYHPYERTDGVYKHRLIYEAFINGIPYEQWLKIIKFNKFEKDHKFITSDISIHHKNRIKTDNRLENLEMLSHSEHQKEHGNYQNFKNFFIPKLENIINIKYIGEEDVYDIKMETPNHNFIANGVVVHNCGKTVQSIAWSLLHPEKRPILVICPSTLKINWQREFNKWADTKSYVINSQDTNLRYIKGIDTYIINYDIVEKMKDLLSKMNFQILILDEAHYMKNPKAKRTKAINELVKIIPHIIALTGTPILNRPIEIYNILKILSPLNFGNYWEFASRYCGMRKTKYGMDVSGATNIQELSDKLRSTVMIRREKRDVLTELPDKTRIVIPQVCDLKAYKKVENDLISYLIEYKNKSKLQAERSNSVEQLAKIEYCKQEAVKAKLPLFVEWCKDFIEENGKLVIFAHHKESINTLMNELNNFNPVKIIGGMEGEEKQKSIDTFMSNKECKVIICSLKAAGVGITLTVSSHVVFLETGWTPGEHDQAEDRCHRIGQKDNVTCYYFVAENTIEETIYNLIQEKRKIFTELMQDKNIINEEKQNIMGDLINKLTEKYT